MQKAPEPMAGENGNKDQTVAGNHSHYQTTYSTGIHMGDTKIPDASGSSDLATEEIMTLPIDRVAGVTKPGDAVPYSPYGYIIVPDGTVYTLWYRCYHGIVLAILYPEVALKAGYEIPIEPHEDNDVYKYQSFELENSPALNVIRIGTSVMIGTTFFSKGNAPATAEQLKAVTACAKALGHTGRDKIETDAGEKSLAQILEDMRQETYYEARSKDEDGF